MMFPDEEDAASGAKKAAVTFNILDMAEERVVEMPNPRPNPDCKATTTAALGCQISFDRSQLLGFIRAQVQGDVDPKPRDDQPQQTGSQSVTVLFNQPPPNADDDDQGDEVSLPEAVQDLLGDESVDAFLVAFVAPAAVEALTATRGVGSDVRAGLLANPHFADLVSQLGQVLGQEERFSAVRGIVDAQG